MLIRTATINDAAQISQLIVQSISTHIAPTLSENGTRHLLSHMDLTSIASFLGGDFRYYVAEEDETILAVSAVKGQAHLYHLFVRYNRLGQGIGRLLWNHTQQEILKDPAVQQITVNASMNSIAFYQRLGFSNNGELIQQHEVRFQPMVWVKSEY